MFLPLEIVELRLVQTAPDLDVCSGAHGCARELVLFNLKITRIWAKAEVRFVDQ